MRKRGPLLAVMTIVMLFQAAPALAHAERVRSSPTEGARLESPPDTVRIDFSEPPIGEASFVVTDGCDRDVVEDLEVQNLEIEASLGTGQPGRWTVQTEVVSALDGHATSDRWTFSVRGTADCVAEPTPAGIDDPALDESSDDGGSFPLLAFAAGTVLLIALALVVRGRSS